MVFKVLKVYKDLLEIQVVQDHRVQPVEMVA
jgi:hypothetical protein